MLSRLRNMFRVPDLRNKILFTLVIVGLYRVGAHLPVPFIDFNAIKDLQRQSQNTGVVGFLDLFSGGAITNVAIFFLGIMPYITASIIMQLLGVVIPKLEEWQNEGQVGQKKITQWTRYLTVGLAVVQSTGFVFALHQGSSGLLGFAGFQGRDLIPGFNTPRAALIVLTWTAGTALLMWLAELITQRGIGNGMSILIFASVVSRLPAQGSSIYSEGSKFQFFTIIGIGIAMIVGIVFVESGQRRIPVQFAKRVVGRRMYGGQSTYIPRSDRDGDPVEGSAAVHQRQPDPASELVLHRPVHDPHHLLRVLLHRDRVQPRATGRHHPQAGRVHPRYQTGAADGAVPREDPEPHHTAGIAVPCHDRDRAVAGVRIVGHQTVPLRGHGTTDHRGRRARDHEADRQPADDAQLRGLPRLIGVRR
jgi:hypothetical protein